MLRQALWRVVPVHFDERLCQLLPFCGYVFVPGKSPFKVQPEILDIFLLRKVYAVDMDWQTGFSFCGE
jgi:hypothetical protein